jgi:hypothetical protein
MRPVIVICGGWSVSQYDVADLRNRGFVIGVNESAVLQQCHLGVTMDRLWAENRAHQYFTTRSGELWVRRGAAKNLAYHPRLRKFDCDHKSSEMIMIPWVFNGTNSGMVALNVALQQGPTHVYIFGLDMQRGPNAEPYYHPPYDWPEADSKGNTTSGKYKEWHPQFHSVVVAYKQLGVTLKQVNNRSAVKVIPSIDYAQFLKETK